MIDEIGFMEGFIERHYLLNRTPVNPDTDILARAAADELGCGLIEAPAGQECLTWRIPMHWRVREAYIQAPSGERVVDFADNPLHLWSHSIPFHGSVSREELDKHLRSDPEHPDWIPFHYANSFQYRVRDWGFCLADSVRRKMAEGEYLVHIDADLDHEGSMKVVDAVLPGRHPETILFSAHTCHQGQAADGLSNVAVLLALHKRLASRDGRKYTYRFVFGPEYFAAAAFLAVTDQAEIEQIKAGVYLDFMGSGQTLGFQHSYPGDALIDRAVAMRFQGLGREYLERGYRELAGNDETFYNGPGFLIPTVGVSTAPYEAYHHHTDDMERLDREQLLQGLDLLDGLVDMLETDFVPLRRYQGPVYLYRYGLTESMPEWWEHRHGLERAQILMDGQRTCFQIAEAVGMDFFALRSFCRALAGKELLEMLPADPAF